MELQLYKLIMLPTMVVTWLASNGSALAGFALSSSRLLTSAPHGLSGKWVNGFRHVRNKR